MDYMTQTTNRYQAQNPSNNYYDQSYTYSHYYQNKRNTTPSQNSKKQNTNMNPLLQKQIQSKPQYNLKSNDTIIKQQSQRNNLNSRIHTNQQNQKSNLNYNNHTKIKQSGNLNQNFNTHSYSNTKNIRQEKNYDEESLLLTDVYGTLDSDTDCENSNNSTFAEGVNHSKSHSSQSSQPFDFSVLLNSFLQNSTQNNSQSNQNNSQNFNNIPFNMSEMPDMETLLKFKKIFERFQNKNNNVNPVTNLLYAIKPFLQESKKSMIDQIAKFITISSVLQDFNSFI